MPHLSRPGKEGFSLKAEKDNVYACICELLPVIIFDEVWKERGSRVCFFRQTTAPVVRGSNIHQGIHNNSHNDDKSSTHRSGHRKGKQEEGEDPLPSLTHDDDERQFTQALV